MSISAHDFSYNKKATIPHVADATLIVWGVKTRDDHDTENPTERKQSVIASIKKSYEIEREPPSFATGSINEGFDYTRRQLKPRHIQLIGIGGTIGTALYLQIGRGLLNGGPG